MNQFLKIFNGILLFTSCNEGSEKLKFLEKSNTFLKSHAEQFINFD